MTGYRDARAEFVGLFGPIPAGVEIDVEPTPAILENHARVIERVEAIVSSVMDG